MNKKYYKCDHPDHEENTSCEDYAVSCSKYCLCCMGEIAIPLDESVPFFESENVIRWKVSEGKESFAYIARVYNGNTLIKIFFGPEAVENANDFIEVQNPLYHSFISSNLTIQQEVLSYSNNTEWYEFNTRELAESFARDNGYKMPIYKSY